MIVRESEERYRLLVAELPDLIIVHQDMKIVFVNNVVTDLLGYSPDEILGQELFTLIIDDYQPLASEKVHRRYSGEEVESYELELRTKNN